MLLSAQGHDVVILDGGGLPGPPSPGTRAPDVILLHAGRSHSVAPAGVHWPPLVGALAEPVLLVLARATDVANHPTYRLAGIATLPVRDTEVLALVRASLP